MKLQLPLIGTQTVVCNGSLCLPLAEFFNSQLCDIDRQLVRDLSFISQLAHYKEGMKISHVAYLQENRFQVHFVYTWHIFQGCIGLDETGEMKDKANFTVSNLGEIQLDLSAFQAQSTADEL
ncbi:MAG: hypothetical protein ISEC1_P0243 [Thiomicrorhabdus sp.]|nr:MAG: hypothetical protein ISEC1_P0243 [Thiomicrorhabdus sp.]